MRLNRQDGGRRRSISVTNNEVSADEQKGLRQEGLRPGDPEWEQWGICDFITKPRIEAAITGKTPDGTQSRVTISSPTTSRCPTGFEENVEFFTLTYESAMRVSSQPRVPQDRAVPLAARRVAWASHRRHFDGMGRGGRVWRHREP